MFGYNCSLSFDKGEKHVNNAFKSVGIFFVLQIFFDPVISAVLSLYFSLKCLLILAYK